MSRLKRVGRAVILLLAFWGVLAAADRIHLEWTAHRLTQANTEAIVRWLSEPVGTRTLPDGRTAPLSRADALAALVAAPPN